MQLMFRIATGATPLPILAALSGLCPGCASPWQQADPNPSLAAEQRHAPSEPAPPPPTSRDVNLEAIEDFLERTREYAVRREASPSLPERHQAPRPQQQDQPVAAHRPPAEPAQPPPQATANVQMALAETTPPKPRLALPVLRSVSVVTHDRTEPPKSQPPKTRTTNAALDVQPDPPAVSWDDLLEQLREEAQTGADVDAHWRLRLVELAMRQRENLLRPAPGLTEETNDLIQAVLRTLISVRTFLNDPTATGEEALKSAEELRQQLADRADPIVSSVALCRRVVTFGVYEEMAPTEFVAGRVIPTIVYCEVDNLRSERTDDGRFETRLGTRLELLTSGGDSVWQTNEPDIVDTCRRRRTDFFIAQRVMLPPTLPAGEYVLKVFVEDKRSGRASEAAHPLTIASAVSIAQTP